MQLTRLLDQLRRHGPQARSQLAEAADMTKAAVASIVGDLVEAGLLVEGDATHTGRSGRPSRSLAITGRWVHGIALEVGRDGVRGAVVDLSGSVVSQVRTLDRSSDSRYLDKALLAAVAGLTGQLLTASDRVGGEVAGVCVAIPGWLACERGPASPQAGPRPDPITVLHEQLTAGDLTASDLTASDLTASDRPHLSVQRRMPLSCLAELRRGTLDADAHLVAIVGDTVVEAGAVVGGRPVAGATGWGGDLAHLVVDPTGHRCRCGGRGCWETVIGVEAVLRECAPDLAGNPHSLRDPLVVREVAARAGDDDGVALDGLATIGFWLGVGLASTLAAFNPRAIQLGGTFAVLAPWLLDPAREALRAHARGPAAEEVELELWRGDSSALVGAGLRATEVVFDDPARFLC